MRKRTLLSHIKAVKRLVLLTLILAAAFPATIREAKAAAGTTLKSKSQMDTWLSGVRRLLTKAMRSDS